MDAGPVVFRLRGNFSTVDLRGLCCPQSCVGKAGCALLEVVSCCRGLRTVWDDDASVNVVRYAVDHQRRSRAFPAQLDVYATAV